MIYVPGHGPNNAHLTGRERMIYTPMEDYDILTVQRMKEETKIENGHWIWIGGKLPNGYGKGWYRGKTEEVHRISTHIFLGMTLGMKGVLALHKDGLCRRRDCWNPEHLYVGTHKDNHRDRIELKTHCPKGHPYSEENTYIVEALEGNYRRCRTCQRDERRNRRKKAKGL